MVKAFIDPGSSSPLIRASCANNLGELKACDVTLSGFGDGKSQCKQKISALVAIDEHEMVTDLWVVEDKDLEYDVLIGRDVLCQKGKRAIIQEDQFWLENIEKVTSRSKNLGEEDSQELLQIIKERRGCLAEKVRELGVWSLKKMVIKLKMIEPVSVKPYRVAFSLREKVRELIVELLCAGIIKASTSSYASPVVVVPNKNGELRLSFDYQLLNRVTVRGPFSMLVIDEQLATLAGNIYFTTMDLPGGSGRRSEANDSVCNHGRSL